MRPLAVLQTRRRPAPVGEVTSWGRQRLLVILAAVAVAAAMLFGGLVYAGYLIISSSSDDSAGATTPEGVISETPEGKETAYGLARRDEIAAAPMLDAPDDAMHPTDSPDQTGQEIEIPSGTQPGPAVVMTGFPHTPEGAIGQLAQIDIAVLSSMSLQTADDVYASWALPGGVGSEQWPITQSVKAFLSAAGMGAVKSSDSEVTIEPAAALVKGTDGPDWVTACVLFKVSAAYRQESQIAFGHCERMQWAGSRWMIAPGVSPAAAPSTWPGTDEASEAGWRTWVATDDGGEAS